VKVVIPAAGLGTRFADLKLGMPKELLPLGGRPLIAHALAEASRAGFEAAIVVLSPSKDQLHQFLAGNELPLPVEIVVQPKPLGIGDAVVRCWQGEPVAVLLPDDVVLGTAHWTNLIASHNKDGAATLCVRPVPFDTISRFGIAECDGDRVVGLVEKPPRGTSPSNLAIFGRYVMTEPVVAGLRMSQVDGELQLTYGFAEATKAAPGVLAVRYEGEIFDCGTPADYASSMARFPT
jgi:UTP--glucose-1-phosphate uridylyltransferase